LIQKKQGLSLSQTRRRLVRPAAFLLNQKHTFPLLPLEPAMLKVIQPLAERKEQWFDLCGIEPG
jgi:hypothetical protein